ncbi:hypothetical protein PspLS_11228 [Pyricularia sp. CBS 133598]|nr:hypothetical protein PspLS_11228 [Pyricularia sp. CBS 133598]
MASRQTIVAQKIQEMEQKASDLAILLEGIDLTIKRKKGVLATDLSPDPVVALQQVHGDRDNVKTLERQFEQCESRVAKHREDIADAIESTSKVYERAKQAVAAMDTIVAQNKHTGLAMMEYHPQCLPYLDRLIAESKENGVFPDDAGVPCTLSSVISGAGFQPRLQDPKMKSQKELQETIDLLNKRVSGLLDELQAARAQAASEKEEHDKRLAKVTSLLDKSAIRERDLQRKVDGLKSLNQKAEKQNEDYVRVTRTLTEENSTLAEDKGILAKERNEWPISMTLKPERRTVVRQSCFIRMAC